MKEESKDWLDKAKEDLDAAGYNLSGGKYNVAVFLCQQASEKALKALLIEKENELIKTHDLVLLARRLNAPPEITEHAKELTVAYTLCRYPGVAEIKNLEAKTEKFLKYAGGVVRWAEKKLSCKS